MPPFHTAVAIHGATGWLVAADTITSDRPTLRVTDTPLAGGRYVAVLNRIDCEGCAAAIENAVQSVRGVGMAGASPMTSTVVFEVMDGQSVSLSDIQQALAGVSEALRTDIALSGLRGPLPGSILKTG